MNEPVCGWCKEPASRLTAGCCNDCWRLWAEVFQELMRPDAAGSPPQGTTATTTRRNAPGSN